MLSRRSGFGVAIVLAALCGCSPPAERRTSSGTANSATPNPEAANLAPRDLEPSNPSNALRPGDAMPAAILDAARHWARSGAAGQRLLVVTFAGADCVPGSACGVAQGKLKTLQTLVGSSPGLERGVGLLTLSADPNDMPATLRRRADQVEADAEVWRFADLPAADAGDVLAALGIPAPSAGLAALVDAEGKLAKLYGDGWSAEEIAQDLQSLVLRADPAVLSAYIDGQQALTRDDLGAATRAFTRLAGAVGEPAVSRLAAAAGKGPDLASVRASFKPLSEALVRLPWPREYQPMFCPMFDDNSGATWVQKAGPVTNPYYGRAMLRCGTDLTEGAHADHSPQFGGVLFMAADAFHHVEGTYERGGVFRVRVYDNFRRQMKVAGFSGSLEVPTTRKTLKLVPSPDGMTFDLHVGTLAFPAEVTLHMTMGPRGDEERFDFLFAEYSPTPPK